MNGTRILLYMIFLRVKFYDYLLLHGKLRREMSATWDLALTFVTIQSESWLMVSIIMGFTSKGRSRSRSCKSKFGLYINLVESEAGSSISLTSLLIIYKINKWSFVLPTYITET